MDVWVFAAAAGAGYVAQQLKNLSKAKRNSDDLSSESLNLLRLTQKVGGCLGQDICGQRKLVGHDACASELTSTCECKDGNWVMGEESVQQGMDSNSDSLAGLLSGQDMNGNSEDRVSSDADGAFSGGSVQSSEIGCSYGVRWCKSNLRSRVIKNKHVKPRNSLESCLMAQLYKENAGLEGYVCSVCSLRKPLLRPSHVTDECRRVSGMPREICNKVSERTQHEPPENNHSLENKSVVGIPRLLDNVPVELQKKANAETGMEQDLLSKSDSELVNENQSNAQGLSDGALQFYLGLTMGIICSFLGNEKEIEKLRKSLKQSENLVQDLQEELEMKDALTVKELVVEDYELLDVQNGPCFDSAQAHLESKLDESSKYCSDRSGKQNADEESLRKIEAELEAELNMLESNINSSRLEGQLSNLAELNPSLVSNVMEGDLRADLFGVKVSKQAYADSDGSNNSTPRSAQYPVSPRELSLRLHEVIQSRLEERIKELETALQHSQCKIKCLESYNPHSPRRDFPNYEMGSASNQESPAARNRPQPPDEPVIINLSNEEAVAAYNDMYEEFTKPSDCEKEEERKPQAIIQTCSKDPDSFQNSHTGVGSICNGSQEMVINPYEGMYNSSRDDGSEEDDEMEKLLIRQIVEKARQGSPAVLKARALLATDLINVG